MTICIYEGAEFVSRVAPDAMQCSAKKVLVQKFSNLKSNTISLYFRMGIQFCLVLHTSSELYTISLY